VLKQDHRLLYTKTIRVADAQYRALVTAMAAKINNLGYTTLYGVPRGGLILALELSYLLKGVRVIIDAAEVIKDGTLIIDDITDTGKTLIEMQEMGFKIATMYYKRQSKVKPLFFMKEADNGVYVEFPYERIQRTML
jgi:hypoxanthine phosphoribosyltransferase